MSHFTHDGPPPGRTTAGLIQRARAAVWIAVDRLPNGQVGVRIGITPTDRQNHEPPRSVWIRSSELEQFIAAIARAEEIVRTGATSDADATGSR